MVTKETLLWISLSEGFPSTNLDWVEKDPKEHLNLRVEGEKT
jgi:hypothetical protein